jgi:hypothetical protein
MRNRPIGRKPGILECGDALRDRIKMALLS